MAQLQFCDAMRILFFFFCAKKKKITIYSTILLPRVTSSTILENTQERIWRNQRCLRSGGKRAHERKLQLKLSHWCHMDCFTDVFTMFLDLGTFQLCCCLWRHYWGWVINDRIFILGWTNPLSRLGIFVAIAKNTLHGSKLSIFLLCQKSLGFE